MDRTTAVETWREVCGSDMVMTFPPTGWMVEAFAARIEARTKEACAIACEVHAAAVLEPNSGTPWSACHECADAIRAS